MGLHMFILEAEAVGAFKTHSHLTACTGQELPALHCRETFVLLAPITLAVVDLRWE